MLTATDKPNNAISRTKLTAIITALFGLYETLGPLFDLPVLTAEQAQPVIIVLIGLIAHFMRSGIELRNKKRNTISDKPVPEHYLVMGKALEKSFKSRTDDSHTKGLVDQSFTK